MSLKAARERFPEWEPWRVWKRPAEAPKRPAPARTIDRAVRDMSEDEAREWILAHGPWKRGEKRRIPREVASACADEGIEVRLPRGGRLLILRDSVDPHLVHVTA